MIFLCEAALKPCKMRGSKEKKLTLRYVTNFLLRLNSCLSAILQTSQNFPSTVPDS